MGRGEEQERGGGGEEKGEEGKWRAPRRGSRMCCELHAKYHGLAGRRVRLVQPAGGHLLRGSGEGMRVEGCKGRRSYSVQLIPEKLLRHENIERILMWIGRPLLFTPVLSIIVRACAGQQPYRAPTMTRGWPRRTYTATNQTRQNFKQPSWWD